MKTTLPLAQYFYHLSHHISLPLPLAVGVSGGPDSMFLAHVVLAYYDMMGRDRSLVHIVHFNHGQRAESKKEQQYVIDAFPDCYRYWNRYIPASGQGETALRRARHEFFRTVLAQENITYLLLGHNLTDRIETSLFNMVRGATNGGWKGMEPTQHHAGYIIMRPLLFRSKRHILDACHRFHVTYMLDATNQTPNNPRNILRNTIIPDICALHAGGEDSWERSRSSLYAVELKSTSPVGLQVDRTFCMPHHSWDATAWYTIPLRSLTPHHMWMLLSDKHQVSYADVQRLWQSLTTGRTTHHKARGYEFFVVVDMLHCVQTTAPKFRCDVRLSKLIRRSGLLQFDGNIYSIRPERVGCTLRYPLAGDVYKGKPLRKILTNKKLPIFLRSITPVVVSGDDIITILS